MELYPRHSLDLKPSRSLSLSLSLSLSRARARALSLSSIKPLCLCPSVVSPSLSLSLCVSQRGGQRRFHRELSRKERQNLNRETKISLEGLSSNLLPDRTALGLSDDLIR
jgi:hypothetical protein